MSKIIQCRGPEEIEFDRLCDELSTLRVLTLPMRASVYTTSRDIAQYRAHHARLKVVTARLDEMTRP